MSWPDRVRPTIKLVSPAGYEFQASWLGDPRSVAKKLGIFNLPRIRGARVQDLEVGADLYTLRLFFEGRDNDLTAEQFFAACRDSGRWRVTHPVKGLLLLQLSSAREVIDPVNSGNITQIDTEWIEPLTPSAVTSPIELAAEVQLQVIEANSAAAEQFEDILATGLRKTKTGAVESVRSYFEVYNNSLANLLSFNEEVRTRVSSVYRGLLVTLAEPVLNGITLSAQVQEWLQLPVLTTSDINARLSAYSDFIGRGIEESRRVVRRDYTGDYTRDLASGQEIIFAAALAAVAQVSVTGAFATRPEAVAGAAVVSDLFVAVNTRLDEIQALLSDRAIDTGKYISQVKSFSQVWLLTAQAVDYILRTSFDLAVERRFTLKKRRSPIEIVISEYGGLGEDDVNFYNFVDANGLHGNEIILLPAGREVVVYI